MSAIVIQTRFGGPEVLEIAEVPTPTATDLQIGEVLVRVAFAGVNPVDTKTRQGGAVAGLFSGEPMTIGWDLAGTVVATGRGELTLKSGDRVFGMSRFPRPGKAYAEFVVADAADLVAIPDSVTDEQAAAIPLAGLTAWENLVDLGQLQRGQRLLIQGAGGGTGHLAVQIAHHLGADVTATASTRKQGWLSELGADRTIDYTLDSVPKLFPERPFDLVFNAADGTARAGILVTRPGGLLIDISQTVTDDDRKIAANLAVRIEVPSVSLNRNALHSLADLASSGRIVCHVSRIFPLADAAYAHREIESGHTQGKILLQP